MRLCCRPEPQCRCLEHLKLLCSRCTPELAEWLGGREEISRPELTSFFWDYVKRNELQVGALPG